MLLCISFEVLSCVKCNAIVSKEGAAQLQEIVDFAIIQSRFIDGHFLVVCRCWWCAGAGGVQVLVVCSWWCAGAGGVQVLVACKSFIECLYLEDIRNFVIDVN